MKSFLRSILVFTILIFSNTYSQDIKAKLKGHFAVDGFTVVDDADNVLFRVTGEGFIGIGTENPEGILDISGETPSVFLPTKGLPIYIRGSHGAIDGGDVNIISGKGNVGFGGNINIRSITWSNNPGNITLETESSNSSSGSITLLTGPSNTGGGGITLKTADTYQEASPINIITGNVINSKKSLNKDQFLGAINLTAGNSDGTGSDINLTPGISTGGGNDGLVKVIGSGTYTGTWTQASDERFKKDIEPLQNSIDKIMQLNGVSYQYKRDDFPEKKFAVGKQIGLIAQDVEKVLPELVITGSDGYKTVAYQNMVAVLIEAVKEQQSAIDNLKKEIEELKNNQRTDVSLTTPTAE